MSSRKKNVQAATWNYYQAKAGKKAAKGEKGSGIQGQIEYNKARNTYNRAIQQRVKTKITGRKPEDPEKRFVPHGLG